MKEQILADLRESILQGRRHAADEGLTEDLVGRPGAVELTKTALEQGIDLKEILAQGLNDAMTEVGKRYASGEYFIPDMLAAAEAVGVAMEVLKPHLAQQKEKTKGKFILATVEKDQHDIGKNIVGLMLRGAGFEVVDLGTDVPAREIASAVAAEGADFVGLSALLDTTMRYMRKTIAELEKQGLREKVKVLIGGAPTSPEFAAEIGADSHCKDAFAAVAAAESFIRGGKN